MSDFTGSFWSSYIAVISIVGILACLVLLWVTARKKNTGNADNTTGHVWDEDLREMNNPLPLWWVGMFVITIIFGLSYLWLYPGLVLQGRVRHRDRANQRAIGYALSAF